MTTDTTVGAKRRYPIDHQPLERRLTNRYVGTYRYEDEWQTLGDVVGGVAHVIEQAVDCDPCDPLRHYWHVTVTTDEPASEADIAAALRDLFSVAGCHHEYDCCGCRSTYVASVRLRRWRSHRTSQWTVSGHSARNY